MISEKHLFVIKQLEIKNSSSSEKNLSSSLLIITDSEDQTRIKTEIIIINFHGRYVITLSQDTGTQDICQYLTTGTSTVVTPNIFPLSLFFYM